MVGVRYILLLLHMPGLWGQSSSLVTVQRSEKIMGERVVVTVVDETEELGYIHIEEALSEFRRIQSLTDKNDPRSAVSRINRNAGREAVEVPEELFSLLQRSTQISRLTEGAFDISIGVLDSLWRYDGTLKQIPGTETIKELLPLIDYQNIQLTPGSRTVFLPREGMRIDLSGIALGYALERAKNLMRLRRVPGGMIHAGGLVGVWGQRASGEQWVLGISDPNELGKMLAWIPLVESATAMLRSDRRYVEYNGERYGEVLDPATGFPARGVQEVTVFSSSAEFCQALSVALTVLGPEASIPIVELLGDTEAIVVDDTGFMYWTSGLLIRPD